MKRFLLSLLISLTYFLAGAAIVSVMIQFANAENVLDQVNRYRMVVKGKLPYLPDPGLQAAAEAGAQAQASRRRSGHHGTMPSSSSEGSGRGRVGPPFRFSTCYHSAAYTDKRGRRHPDWYSDHRYAGAAIVDGYACLSLDNDRNHGAIGSAGRGRVVRRGLFRRWRN